MGSFSLMHWIVVVAIIVILFGAGKLPRVMGDFAKGIKTFKAGMKEEMRSKLLLLRRTCYLRAPRAIPQYRPPASSNAPASPARLSRPFVQWSRRRL